VLQAEPPTSAPDKGLGTSEPHGYELPAVLSTNTCSDRVVRRHKIEKIVKTGGGDRVVSFNLLPQLTCAAEMESDLFESEARSQP
jgi:hypothetical protein